jgi:hypothetical protein
MDILNKPLKIYHIEKLSTNLNQDNSNKNTKK